MILAILSQFYLGFGFSSHRLIKWREIFKLKSLSVATAIDRIISFDSTPQTYSIDASIAASVLHAIGDLTVHKQFFCYLNFGNHRTKESFISAADRSLGPVAQSMVSANRC